MLGVSSKMTKSEKKFTPAQMAAGLARSHGEKYAKRLVEKLLLDIAPETRANLPVGDTFYDQVGPKDWRLRVGPLDKTLKFWLNVQIELKKF
jgi:hypothetical protein